MLSSKFLIILGLIALVSSAGCGCGASKDEVLEMGRTIERELPIGSTEAQVVKYLDERHLLHKAPTVIANDPVPRYRKLRQTGVAIENFWHNEPVMYLMFYFDDTGMLVESKVWNGCGLGCYTVRNKTADGGGEFRNMCE